MNETHGMLVGLAVGDALGANFEFTIFSHEDVTDDMIKMRDGMWPKGAWTDDTSMALCLGKSLVECGGYDSYDVMGKYRRWAEEGFSAYDNRPASDVGNQARAAIERFKREPIVGAGEARSENAGNGALMRLAPAVLATREMTMAETMRLAKISARETHFSEEAEAAAEIFAAMLKKAMDVAGDLAEDSNLNAAKAEILDVAEFSTSEIYDEILARVLAGSAENCRGDLEDLGGYAVDALTIAVFGFRNYQDFESGMRAVLKLGGDTDTNGAIFGQIAGAFYGYDKIPQAWREELLRENEIRELADALGRMKNCPIVRTRFEEDEL